MTIHFIGAGPGAPDLLTLRAVERLRTCQLCLYAGSLVPEAVLAHTPDEARLVDTAPLTLEQIIDELVRADAEGLEVVRLHSGDLAVYSAVAEQVRRLEAAGVDYTLCPGVPAFSAAAAALGRELTVPEVSQSVVLTRTSGRASAMPERETLATFAASGATLCIHLSLHAIDRVVEELLPWYGPDCPAVVAFRVSWPDEAVVRASLATLAGAVADWTERRSAVILVGPAVEPPQGFRDSALYDPAHVRRFRGG